MEAPWPLPVQPRLQRPETSARPERPPPRAPQWPRAAGAARSPQKPGLWDRRAQGGPRVSCWSVLTFTPTAASGARPPAVPRGLTAEQLHEAHVAAGVESQSVGRDAEGLEYGRAGDTPHGQAALQAHRPGLLLAEAAVPQREDVGQGHVLLPTQAPLSRVWGQARAASRPSCPGRLAPASRLTGEADVGNEVIGKGLKKPTESPHCFPGVRSHRAFSGISRC